MVMGAVKRCGTVRGRSLYCTRGCLISPSNRCYPRDNRAAISPETAKRKNIRP